MNYFINLSTFIDYEIKTFDAIYSGSIDVFLGRIGMLIDAGAKTLDILSSAFYADNYQPVYFVLSDIIECGEGKAIAKVSEFLQKTKYSENIVIWIRGFDLDKVTSVRMPNCINKGNFQPQTDNKTLVQTCTPIDDSIDETELYITTNGEEKKLGIIEFFGNEAKVDNILTENKTSYDKYVNFYINGTYLKDVKMEVEDCVNLKIKTPIAKFSMTARCDSFSSAGTKNIKIYNIKTMQ